MEVDFNRLKGKTLTLEWGDYVLLLEGKEYKSKFKSIDDWYNYYRKE